MRRTKEEAAKTRQDLLDAALQVFSQQGYQAARLQDIARAAGVTRGAIYHHFGSKAELFNTLMDEASAQESGVMEAAVAEGGSLAEIMARILRYSLALLEEDQRLRQIFELSQVKAGADPELLTVQRKRAEQTELLVGSTAAIMAQGIADGQLRAGLEPDTVARAFIAYQNGVATLWLSNRQAFSLKQQAADFADIFMAGLVAA
ncbi:MAG TPA: TetR family transcriptional regulator [Anaerolineae bacterium]|jgi:TetR/AcrR family acrAB operon transcriptional repressor|nr:TetR family transcriptional regulator [Anaerolineae bacterium]